jgi:hypothetical protein
MTSSMASEKDLQKLLKTLNPVLHPGEYVFCMVRDLDAILVREAVLIFREEEGVAVIITKEIADQLGHGYSFVASWITLTVHSSLEAVGLTAAFSGALAAEKISCNVIAAYFHDHIFVAKKDAQTAMIILKKLSS